MLLIDKDLIDRQEGLSLTVCEAVPYPGNPILKRGGPGSVDETHAQFPGSVWHIDGKFRMWYLTHGKAEPWWGTGYAESTDGLHWVKLDLGLQKYGGNIHNNLVNLGSRGAGGVVFYDPEDPNSERRYKIPVPIVTSKGRWGIGTLAYSPDGLHWRIEERETPMCGSDEDGEGQFLFRVDKIYFITTQQMNGDVETRPGYSGRAVALFYSDDPELRIWKKAQQAAWFIPAGSGPYEAHMGIAPWARQNLIIGLYGIFHDQIELEDAYTGLGLVLSHDGFHWWEPWPLATVLRRGPMGGLGFKVSGSRPRFCECR